jgi:predicted transcriptional regulator
MKNNPSSKDELVRRKSFLDSVGRGIEDADNGRTYSTDEVKAALAAKKKKSEGAKPRP